jgi:small subunit ribosomal protein S16
MLRIRLLKVGKKNRPSFRLAVLPRRTAPQSGRFLEILGFYNPIEHSKSFKAERITYWLSQGAQPSDGVKNLLIKEGIMKGKKVSVHKRSKKSKGEDTQEAKAGSPVSENDQEQATPIEQVEEQVVETQKTEGVPEVQEQDGKEAEAPPSA